MVGRGGLASARPWRRFSPPGRAFALDAALFLLVFLWAIASMPHLRFSAVLHGDEPKYMRYCENFYQGRGLHVEDQQTLDELGLGYSPPLWRNAIHFALAVRTEAVHLARDARVLLSEGLSFQYNRAEFVDGWFLRGKDGGFYQVHNPGLSMILFPAYFVDRHFLSTSSGYQDIFPTSLPVTNLAILLIWSVWAVAIYRFLQAFTNRRASPIE